MTTMMMESGNPNRMAFVFDENQRKYKCCCGNMRVRTGALIVATLKMFGVLMAVMDIFTTGGPSSYYTFSSPNPSATDTNFGPSSSNSNNDNNKAHIVVPSAITTTTTSTHEEDDAQDKIWMTMNNGDNDNTQQAKSISITTDGDPSSHQDGFGALRTSSTVLYLLLEAVAVSCLIYAIRRERPKFVIPEMAFISVCMSLELIAALLLIVAAAFGSDTLLEIIVQNMRERGRPVTQSDEYQIRRMLPTVLTLMAFMLLIAAALEFWFFNVLRGFYRYLRDKAAFGYDNRNNLQNQQQHMVIMPQQAQYAGYQPMAFAISQQQQSATTKDTPPGYNEVVKPEEQHQHQHQEGASATAASGVVTTPTNQPPPPAYTEAVQGAENGNGQQKAE